MRKKMLFSNLAILLMVLFLAGCASKKAAPADEDQTQKQEVEDREKKIAEMMDNSGEKDSNLAVQELMDQIYNDLLRYDSLGVPPIRDARTDEIMRRVFFDFDDSTLRPEFHDALTRDATKVLAYLEEKGLMYLQIEGHADERGSVEYNVGLGHRRANTVKNFLQTFSKNPVKFLRTVSFGEEFPAVEGNNEYAWAQNRRVVFTFMLIK